MKPQKLLFLFLLIFLCAEVRSQDYKILRVENVRDGWNKLKLGNNPNSFWNPKVDVTAGGNTHLDIEFRVSEGTPDMSRIQIRPNGYSANPVNFADYLLADFSFGFDWYTISIPLADFDPGINFTQLNLLQLPYSNMAGTFVMELRSVAFTGGTSPYVWFGDGKRDNIHDGFGYSGQMIAAVEKEFYFDYAVDFPGERYMDYYFDPGTVSLSEKCQQTTVTLVKDEQSTVVNTPAGIVSDCKFVPGDYTVSHTMADGRVATDHINVPAAKPLQVEVDGYKVTVKGGTGSYFVSDGIYLPITDSAENYTWAKIVGDQQYNYYSNVSADLEGNSYMVTNGILQKRDGDGNIVYELNTSGAGHVVYAGAGGACYLAGSTYDPSFSMGNVYLGNDDDTPFLARISPEGTVDWLRKTRSSVSTLIGDGKGHIYTLDTPGVIRKYSITGHLIWERGPGSDYESESYFSSFTLDDEGSVYVGTRLNINNTYGGTDIPDFQNAKEDQAVVVIKLNPEGDVLWMKGLSFATDIRGLVYGNFGLIYLIKTHYLPLLSSTLASVGYVEAMNKNGQDVFQTEITMGVFTTPTSITTDPAGYVYAGSGPNVIKKLDPLGHIINTITIPTSYYYRSTPFITATKAGQILVAGIGDGYGQSFIPDLSYEDIFLASLSPANTFGFDVPENMPGPDFVTVEDARGQSIIASFNINNAVITGITGIGANTYEISWKPPYNEVSGYEVFGKTGNTHTLIASVSSSQISFIDNGLSTAGEKPEYSIKALTKQGEGMSAPHSPAVLSAKAETGGKVNLTWQPYTGYEDPSYTLYRGADEFSMEPVSKLKGEQLSYSDKLPASGDYLYRLEVTGKDGSSMSNTVSISSDASEHTVALWPNPATDMINCRWEGRSRSNTLELTDLQGRLVAEMHNVDPSGYELKRGNTPAGIYLLTFEDASGKTTGRLVFR